MEERGGKRGAENTDGNYRNRNAEDKKSHTDREEKSCAFTHTKMYIHDEKRRPRASTFTPAGQTRTLKLADG